MFRAHIRCLRASLHTVKEQSTFSWPIPSVMSCRSFEMALAACASPLVGFLAEKVFGFKGAAAAGEGGGTGPDQGEDLTKAKALGNALLVCLVVPWTICLIVYTGQSCNAITQSVAQRF